jgi:hypothetical protein
MLPLVLSTLLALALPGSAASLSVDARLGSANRLLGFVVSNVLRDDAPATDVDEDGSDAGSDAAVITRAHLPPVPDCALFTVARSPLFLSTRFARPSVPRGPPSRLTCA